jgi:hypothetical protein
MSVRRINTVRKQYAYGLEVRRAIVLVSALAMAAAAPSVPDASRYVRYGIQDDA